MGFVVQAMHLQLQQPVAVKFLLPEFLGNAEIVQRFLREARAAVRFRSEHVARVLDVGALESGDPYMVLEYLEGADLADFPRTQLTIGLTVDLMLQACEALAEAHAMGIVHRDIKPGNIFITRRADGSLLLKILDFGLSKAPAMLDSRLTAAQTVIGTPAYMSPEQMKALHDLDHRSDIWSLGVVLYELLQGEPPFRAESFTALALKVATEPLPPLAGQLPAGLADIVHRCLEKEPERRFQSIAELAQALAPYAQSTAQAALSVERTSRVAGAWPPRPRSDSGVPATAPVSGTSAPRTARRWPYVAGALTLLSAFIAVAIVLSGHGGDRDEQALGPPAIAPDAPAAPSPEPPPPAPPPAPPAEKNVATAPPDAAPEAAPTVTPMATAPEKPSRRSGPRGPRPPKSPDSPEDILETRN